MRLTTADVADLLRVSQARVRQYVDEGRLVARTEGSKRLYFLPHEVQAFCLAMPVYGAGAAITTGAEHGAGDIPAPWARAIRLGRAPARIPSLGPPAKGRSTWNTTSSSTRQEIIPTMTTA